MLLIVLLELTFQLYCVFGVDFSVVDCVVGVDFSVVDCVVDRVVGVDFSVVEYQ